MLATHSVRQLVHFARVGFQPVQDRLETILPTQQSAEIPASQRVGAPQASFRGFVRAIEAAFELVRRHAVLLHTAGIRLSFMPLIIVTSPEASRLSIEGVLDTRTPAVHGRCGYMKQHCMRAQEFKCDPASRSIIACLLLTRRVGTTTIVPLTWHALQLAMLAHERSQSAR